MDYQLVVVRGRSGAQALQLADGVTTVGRHDDCQLRIKSSQVSRKHCELFEKKGLLLVKDLGSANGTYVNGQKVDGQRVLEPGDELTIGQVRLRVEKRGAASAAPSPLAGAKPNDTAISAAAVDTAAAPADDEFEIDFETTAAPDTDFTVEPAGDEEPDIDALLNEPVPTTAPPPPAAAPAAAAPPAEPEPTPEAEKPVAEDAIADFLLDIKIDEDDR